MGIIILQRSTPSVRLQGRRCAGVRLFAAQGSGTLLLPAIARIPANPKDGQCGCICGWHEHRPRSRRKPDSPASFGWTNAWPMIPCRGKDPLARCRSGRRRWTKSRTPPGRAIAPARDCAPRIAKRSIDACDLADRNRTALAKHVRWTGARRSNKRRSVRECVSERAREIPRGAERSRGERD